MTIKFDNLCKIDGCNNQAETKQLCNIHYWSEIRKKSAQKSKEKAKIKQKKINAVSERGKVKAQAYKNARKEYLELHECCEVKLPGCSIPTIEFDSKGLQIHHKKGRIGDLLTDKNYFLAVCHNCHVYLEQNPLFARLHGYSLSRLSK